ncbi:hypothetical protein FNU76_00285 [Chitinimonas arctica]|uniref:Uncharacterized protein n=1 Tax=Chitinimonas arctica TaxID=2594795 RepID=A0A516S9S7_9NEIS|nr:hypothetical protein [Chitinimonas arctica]QDQ24904.1 hypothetical protein FNU76_00285 [Chitinimonas arctica]
MKRKRKGSDGDPVPVPLAPPTFAPTVTYKRQKRATIGTPTPPSHKVGTHFYNTIDKIRDGADKSVTTKLNLQIQKSGHGVHTYPIVANIHAIQHGTDLTQGNLHTSNATAYQDILPYNLSPQRAKLEGRVIKRLSPGGEHYDEGAKISEVDELNLTQKQEYPKKTPLGGIAIGSFLEDVTAKRAVGLEDIGSAIRAKTMATKWQMKVAGNEHAGYYFDDHMFEAFPQLGKGGQEIHGLKDTGIAAMKAHWAANGKMFSKADQLKAISKAHKSAFDGASSVFNQKASALFTGSAKFSDSGKWWTSNKANIKHLFAEMKSGDEKRVETANKAFGELGQTYLTRKLTRHGIKMD